MYSIKVLILILVQRGFTFVWSTRFLRTIEVHTWQSYVDEEGRKARDRLFYMWLSWIKTSLTTKLVKLRDEKVMWTDIVSYWFFPRSFPNCIPHNFLPSGFLSHSLLSRKLFPWSLSSEQFYTISFTPLGYIPSRACQVTTRNFYLL